MILKEIISALEEAFPLNRQENFDNSGLQIGDPEVEVSGALLAIDIDEKVLSEAKEKGLNLVITHHPLLFHPAKRITPSSYIERCITYAIRHEIAIYAAHTNADNSLPGLNTMMADIIGMEKCIPLQPRQEDKSQGGGLIGNLKEKVSIGSFLRNLKQILPAQRICYSKCNPEQLIQTVAMCTGSGAFMYSIAKELDADIFITGEAKYNDFYDAQDGPILITAGHFETEWFSVKLFKSIISSKLPNFACQISEQMSNPVNYL